MPRRTALFAAASLIGGASGFDKITKEECLRSAVLAVCAVPTSGRTYHLEFRHENKKFGATRGLLLNAKEPEHKGLFLNFSEVRVTSPRDGYSRYQRAPLASFQNESDSNDRGKVLRLRSEIYTQKFPKRQSRVIFKALAFRTEITVRLAEDLALGSHVHIEVSVQAPPMGDGCHPLPPELDLEASGSTAFRVVPISFSPGGGDNWERCQDLCCIDPLCFAWTLRIGVDSDGPECVGVRCCFLHNRSATQRQRRKGAITGYRVPVLNSFMLHVLFTGEREQEQQDSKWCSDQNAHCEAWAADGECENNSEYMHGFCRKSCKRCATAFDFRWLPNLHTHGDELDSVVGDHFFRSPVAMSLQGSSFLALLPDVSVLNTFRLIPHALDLRAPAISRTDLLNGFDPESMVTAQYLHYRGLLLRRLAEQLQVSHAETGNTLFLRQKEMVQAQLEANEFSIGRYGMHDKLEHLDVLLPQWPQRLSYGLAFSEIVPHHYSKTIHDIRTWPPTNSPVLSFRIAFGVAEGTQIISSIATHIWHQYGATYLNDVRPQVLPFAEYARRHTYSRHLKKLAHRVEFSGLKYWAISNPGRRGVQFDAWENDVDVAIGITYFSMLSGESWLTEIASDMVRLSIASPELHGAAGAFPTVYNDAARLWEASMWMHTSKAGCDPLFCANTAAMSVTVNLWFEHEKMFGSERMQAGWFEKTRAYAKFLRKVQLSSGAVPHWVVPANSTHPLRPHERLRESAASAISGVVLARFAHMASKHKVYASDAGFSRKAARSVGVFVRRSVLPEQRFWDFETFFSCAMKDETFRDLLAGIRPMSTLALQWVADLFLILHITGIASDDGTSWLADGEVVLAILSLFQQVWAPPYFYSEGYLFGGFGVQNTDSEWNAGHQHRFAVTYADYYEATGNLEYLERAVAATRAGFALMDIEENKANNVSFAEVEGDLDAEGFEHLGGPGDKGLWTGLTWGSGGALSAAATLLHRFGGAYVDVKQRKVVSIDGVTMDMRWPAVNPLANETDALVLETEVMILNVRCALGQFQYNKSRTVRVRFGRVAKLSPLKLILNGVNYGELSVHTLAEGLNVTVGTHALGK